MPALGDALAGVFWYIAYVLQCAGSGGAGDCAGAGGLSDPGWIEALRNCRWCIQSMSIKRHLRAGFHARCPFTRVWIPWN